jgi:hypothetical protein
MAVARIAQLQAQWVAAKADLQPKFDAVTVAREAAMAAEAERTVAVQAAQDVARDLEPASVFISRKTQRLYVRRAFEPILDAPITILNPDQPVGTHVFTAMEQSNGGTDLRWTVATLDDGHPRSGVKEPRGRARAAPALHPHPIATEPVTAKDALDRVVIPPEILERINQMTLPRSSLIISDEPLSSETGKGTEFVLVLSGEPQGGIKFRARAAGI